MDTIFVHVIIRELPGFDHTSIVVLLIARGLSVNDNFGNDFIITISYPLHHASYPQ